MIREEVFWNAEIETMNRGNLEKLQLRRLKWQLKSCYENSAFYREKFKRANIKPEQIKTLDDLVKVPFVTKQELRDEQAKYPPFGRYILSPKENWRELHPSTGTTGVPVNTIWSEKDVENITDVTARTMWSFGTRPGDIVQNAFSYGLWVAGLSVHYASRRIGCLVIPIGAGMTSRQIDYFINPGATVLLATPSYALYIAEKMRERSVSVDDIQLSVGCFGGEAGAGMESTRKRIERGLGIDAYDYYGLAEIGPTMASECTEKAGLHWSEDHHIIEIIDSKTMERCSPREVGVAVITHLTREATPMIRYWTNDYTKIELDKCACGRTHARSPGGILGRADDLFICKGAKFYPVQVEKVIRSYEELGDEFRIELTRDPETGLDVCTIIVECLDERANIDELKERLRKDFKEELLVTPEVKLLKYGLLERTEFKAKRIMDKR